MCLDNKKLLILDTDMATNPCMYSGTQKSNIKKTLSVFIFVFSRGRGIIEYKKEACKGRPSKTTSRNIAK
jgi:hypothetical protein